MKKKPWSCTLFVLKLNVKGLLSIWSFQSNNYIRTWDNFPNGSSYHIATEPTSCQSLLSIPPENIKKPNVFYVFREYRKRPMAWNGLMLWENLSSKSASLNQSVDLQSKSMGWFLYDRDLHHERVNSTCEAYSKLVIKPSISRTPMTFLFSSVDYVSMYLKPQNDFHGFLTCATYIHLYCFAPFNQMILRVDRS